MRLEPPNLNIPLQRKDRLLPAAAFGCVLTIASAWQVDVDFAKAFLAVCIVEFPAVWIFVSPPNRLSEILRRTGVPMVIGLLIFFAYVSLTKSVLVPRVLSLLEQLFGV